MHTLYTGRSGVSILHLAINFEVGGEIFVHKIEDKYYSCFCNLSGHSYHHRLFTLRASASNL